MISIIVAMDTNRVIGKDNQMPWHMPADLRHFKEMTMGKPIVMGRKTYDSIGRPLPGRRNVIITRQQDLKIEGVEIVHSLPEALKLLTAEPEIMIIGGGQVFNEALPLATRLYFTIIEHEFAGDTYFPAWEKSDWQLIEQEAHPADEKNPYPYQFAVFQRA